MEFSCHINSYSVLQLFLLSSSCFLGFGTAIDTIRVNQSLRDPETLISNGKKFKLGFFSPPDSSYRYVGVMYNLPVMTVVWVANRDKPLNDSTGSLEISEDGNLVILDGRNEKVWSTNLSNSVANSSAVLYDTGNLVLQDNSNNTLWESFQHPSDSFVPEMKILTDLSTKEKIILTSWRNPSDPALGSFTLTIEPLDIPQVFVWKDSHPYWRSGPWNHQKFVGTPYANSFYNGGIQVVSDSPGTAYFTHTQLNSSVLIYYVLNSSGNIQEQVCSNEKGDWEVTWSSIFNECEIYGKCGPFGSCNAHDRPICTCFPGFVPKDKDEWNAGNWSSGCTRKTHLQCEENNSAGKQDGFLELNGVKLPDHFKWFAAEEEECRSQCLNNCSCIAYAYTSGIGCMQWTENLIDVQKFSNGVADLYIRLSHSELDNKKDYKAIITTTVVIGSIIIPVSAYFLWKLLLKYRGRKEKNQRKCSTIEKTNAVYSEENMLQDIVHRVKLEELPLFKFQMLSNATDKFDLAHRLGQGGFGPVYKGKLPNGQEIAVKRQARSSNQGLEEFMNEVEVISRLQHRNLVKLHGCCVENKEKMLVYEYMPNGSLDLYLFGSRKDFLDWSTRKIIIQGICRGLLYLHRDSRLRIIHRDLKASNILLDGELNPKISDFGLARIFGGKDNQANTGRVVGTYGYMSPEYALHGIFSEKSDVYSFGVLLLEIVSGRRNAHFYDEDQQIFLVAYAWKLWNEEKIVHLMDPAIYDLRIEADIVRYTNVGLLCVQEIAADRPNISTVLSMLSCEIVDLPRPKQPAFLGIQRPTKTESSPKNSCKCSVNDVTVSTVEGR